MLIDIYMKFFDDSYNGFQVIEQTRFCDRVQGNNSKSINARVMVLVYTPHLMLIDIYMKFHRDSLNSFQVLEWPQFCDGQSFKENNSKSIKARVMVLALCTSSNVD